MDPPLTQDELRQRLAARIKALRAAEGIGQEPFADRAGIHRVQLSKIETATVTPGSFILYRIAVAFGLTLSELVDGIDAPAKRTRRAK